MGKKTSSKENIDLAEEHIKIAEDIIVKEGKNSKKGDKKFIDAEVALEKAETDLEEIEDDLDDNEEVDTGED